MSKTQNEYEELHEISRHARTLEGISSILRWDQETFMPANAAKIRAEQIKSMAGIIHKERTSKEFASKLNKLIDVKTGEFTQENNLTSSQKSALKQWRRDFIRDTSLPQKFVEDFAKLCSESVYVWEKAKKENNFDLFLPHLEKVIEMSRKKADYLKYQDHPYDALLDEYEPNMTTKDVKGIFGPLQKSTIALLKKIQAAKQVKDDFLKGKFDENKQKSFNDILLKMIDYPATSGRLDVSCHPFSSSAHPTDSRITTRILPQQPMSNIRSVLHECGHAFYEMGLPPEEYGSPLGESISLGIHESQSRWWETRIGLSKAFWKHCLPLLKNHFKGKFEGVTLDAFWKAINKVEPSMIRVEADEVTYALHVILRFELETQLIEGSLAAKDIPEAWNSKMQELLGITPKNNAEGCLQDIHWSMGGFGYFSTYTLGNLYASHFFQAFEKDQADWEKQVAKGEFQFIKDWLGKNIHQHGKRYTGKELLKKVTGKNFSSKAFEEYLANKYSEVYKIK
jgi:carboxypeptidase Taq